MTSKEKKKYDKMMNSLRGMRRLMSIWIRERGLTDELVECMKELEKDERIMHLEKIINMKDVEINNLRDKHERDEEIIELHSIIEQQEHEICDLKKELTEYKGVTCVEYKCTTESSSGRHF